MTPAAIDGEAAIFTDCVELADQGDASIVQDIYILAYARRAGLASQQEARAQSTGTSQRRDTRSFRPGPAATKPWPLLSDVSTSRPTPEQTSNRNWTSRDQSKPTSATLVGGNMTDSSVIS